MPELTPTGHRTVEEIAERHGFGVEAVRTVLAALAAGDGVQAQFDHPELGGMGQWSQGGMLMIGDMFNHALKARVDALCTELAAVVRSSEPLAPGGARLFEGRGGGNWWPRGLGAPSATGAQNAMRYAVFPGVARLAVERGGEVRVYDTGDHRIGGVSQQQSGATTLTFTSQHGLVRLEDLRVAAVDAGGADRVPTPAAAPGEPGPVGPLDRDGILTTIERLADLRRKEIITEEEFAAKKTDLLGRL